MYARNSASNALDLDKEYSPSLNTKRFQDVAHPNEQVLEHFLDTTKAQTQAARANYNVRENIYYGLGVRAPGDNQLLDIYYGEKENDTPIFVYIHGGYWQALDKSSSGSFVAPLIALGYRVLVVDYNLCPQVTLEELTTQMGHCYRWLFAYAQSTNARKFSVCGHSAGAHLAALLLSEEFMQHEACSLASFFLISGLFDLRELWQLESANPDNVLALDAAKAAELSPLCWRLSDELIGLCKQQRLAFHVLVAANDSITFIEQSRAFAQKLTDAGLNVAFKMFDDYDHFDIIEQAAYEGTAINDHLVKNMK